MRRHDWIGQFEHQVNVPPVAALFENGLFDRGVFGQRAVVFELDFAHILHVESRSTVLIKHSLQPSP